MAEKEYVLGNKTKDLLTYTFTATKPVSDRVTDNKTVIELLTKLSSLEGEEKNALISQTTATLEKEEKKQGFPKSAVHTYVNEMRETSIRILKDIHAANECSFQTEYARRITLINSALDECNLLLQLVEISKDLGYINLKRMAYWTKLITDVKYMTLAWKKKDTARAKELSRQSRDSEYHYQAAVLSEAISRAIYPSGQAGPPGSR